MPVLFFYTNVETGSRIRDLLGMQDPKGPYFDPASKGVQNYNIYFLFYFKLLFINAWLKFLLYGVSIMIAHK